MAVVTAPTTAALRDFGLLLGVLTLARLATAYDGAVAAREVRSR